MRGFISACVPVLLTMLGACGPLGPVDDPALPRSTAPIPPSSASEVASAEPEDSAAALKGAPPTDQEKASRIADKLLAGWIGWDPKRKAFVVITTFSEAGGAAGVLGSITDDRNAYDGETTLCEPQDPCEPGSQALVDRTAAWLEEQGLTGTLLLESVPFKDEAQTPTADLVAIGGKLVFKRDHFEIARGTATQALPKADLAKEFAPHPSQAAASPDGAYVVALIQMAPGKNASKGFNDYVDIRVYKLAAP